MKITKIIPLAVMLACPAWMSAQHNITDGIWNITFDESAKTLTYEQNGTQLVKGAYVEVHNAAEEQLLSKNYPNVSLTSEAVSDVFGNGTKYTYTYSGLAGKENIEQSIYIYPGKNYLLVEAAIVAADGTTKSNYIAPMVSTTSVTFLPSGGETLYTTCRTIMTTGWVIRLSHGILASLTHRVRYRPCMM